MLSVRDIGFEPVQDYSANPYVSCYKFVTNLSQEAKFLLLLMSLLASGMILLYSISSSTFFEANNMSSYMVIK